MRDNNDIMVRNFGTGLWGVSNVTVRTSVWSDDIDIVDADNSSNVITISGDVVRAIVNSVSNN
tara:strand:+ start:669 stop:857 length:189 start_codon:yes stop_codon:yes gene_type:complete